MVNGTTKLHQMYKLITDSSLSVAGRHIPELEAQFDRLIQAMKKEL